METGKSVQWNWSHLQVCHELTIMMGTCLLSELLYLPWVLDVYETEPIGYLHWRMCMDSISLIWLHGASYDKERWVWNMTWLKHSIQQRYIQISVGWDKINHSENCSMIFFLICKQLNFVSPLSRFDVFTTRIKALACWHNSRTARVSSGPLESE